MAHKRRIFAFILVAVCALAALKLASSVMSLMAPDDEARRVSASSLLRAYDNRNRTTIKQLENAHADQDTIAYVRTRSEQARALGDELRRDIGFAYPGDTARAKFREYVRMQCEIERKVSSGMTQSPPWAHAVFSRESYNKNARTDMQFGCS